MDNQAVAAIVKSGNNKIYLQKLVLDSFRFSNGHDVILHIEWIPRSENEVADYSSTIVHGF